MISLQQSNISSWGCHSKMNESACLFIFAPVPFYMVGRELGIDRLEGILVRGYPQEAVVRPNIVEIVPMEFSLCELTEQRSTSQQDHQQEIRTLGFYTAFSKYFWTRGAAGAAAGLRNLVRPQDGRSRLRTPLQLHFEQKLLCSH